MKPHRQTRLPRWQEWAVYTSLGLLMVSGITWLLFDQWVRVAGDFGPEHHAAEHWMLIAHGVGAYVFLVVAGALIPVHVQVGWRIGRNLKSGVTLASICMLLALTALGLYYFGDEIARHWTSIVHWVIGLALLPVVLIHAINGRRGA